MSADSIKAIVKNSGGFGVGGKRAEGVCAKRTPAQKAILSDGSVLHNFLIPYRSNELLCRCNNSPPDSGRSRTSLKRGSCNCLQKALTCCLLCCK